MINLKFLNLCSSVLNKPNFQLDKSLNFVTDTRKIKPNSAFVAIPGTRINPLKLILENFNSFIELIIYQASTENDHLAELLKDKNPQVSFLKVSDSVLFLQQLTSLHIRGWQKRDNRNILFAISGSNGKTTHKEMLSFILNYINPGKIVSTEKNNNNHLGVPLTLLNVSDETEFVVLELGSNHPGEIEVLCNISHPNSGLTTNIGATHLEFFQNEENVFKEEGYLYHSVKKNTSGEGFYLINFDDSFLKTLQKTKGALTFGEHQSSDIVISFTEKGVQASWLRDELCIENNLITGKHNKLNLIICSFIAFKFYPEFKNDIIKAASEFKPTKNRSEWIDFQSKPVFLDAYNANPSSMKAAILAFKESFLKRGLTVDEACLILGDMNELGENAPVYHKELGEFLRIEGFKNVYFIGRYADSYLQGFPNGKKRNNVQEFKEEFLNIYLKNFAIHFIKGSRSLQLESLFDIT